jgi:hypothetical protein
MEPAQAQTWWAQVEFTRINIAPTILQKQLEDAREAGAKLVKAAAFATNVGLRAAERA